MTYIFSFNQLNIRSADLEDFIGYRPGDSLDAYGAHYDAALLKAAEICRIKAGYRLFPGLVVRKKEIIVAETLLTVGEIIAEQLRACTGVVVFVCTAGHELSELPRKLAKQNDALMAYLFDVIGSICVEKAANQIESILHNELSLQGNGISNRCSPGYCGWDVAEQKKLFALLPEGFCGVRLSETSMMDPIKSISGIIGYGPGASRRNRPCKQCSDSQCTYIS